MHCDVTAGSGCGRSAKHQTPVCVCQLHSHHRRRSTGPGLAMRANRQIDHDSIRALVMATDGHRVRKFVYGAYDETAEKPNKLQDQERNGVPVPSRSWKVGEWLTYWLDQIVKPDREHNTYLKYESKIRLYLVPHLGKKPLSRPTPAQIRTFMSTLDRDGVPAATRVEVLRVLRNALNRAQHEEIVTRNMAELVDMPKVSKQEREPWTAREAITFLRSAKAHRLYAASVLVLVQGLRRSEVLGLRWQDIDFDNQHFTPVKQVQREPSGHGAARPAHLRDAAGLLEGASQGGSGDPSAQPDQHDHGRVHTRCGRRSEGRCHAAGRPAAGWSSGRSMSALDVKRAPATGSRCSSRWWG